MKKNRTDRTDGSDRTGRIYQRHGYAWVFRFLHRRWRRFALAFAAVILLGLAILLWPMDVTHFLAAQPSGEVLDRSGRPLYAFLNERQQWCFARPLESINPLLLKATVAAEDRRFWRHPGVDALAAARACWQLLRHGGVRSGASTLTMQVVKLAGHPSNSIAGKIYQSVEALRLDRHAEKSAILAAYLNRAPYGRNLVGCEAAARRYFGKPARELSLPEAALLAAIPKSPARLDPLGEANSGHSRQEWPTRRRNWVLARMAEEGFISEAEHARAAAAPLGSAWHEFPELAPHLAQRLAPLARARTRLATTIDRDLQATAEALVREHVRAMNGEAANAGLIVAGVRGASVLAWVGSGDFWNEAAAGQVDAARAPRSPGSALKPFIYGLAIQQGRLYPSEVLLDGSFDLGAYNPKNFDKRYHGLIAADEALRRSLNVPAIAVLERIGTPTLLDFLRQAGLTTLGRPAWTYGLSLAIGNCEARLDELCAAYCTIAGQGRLRPLRVLIGGDCSSPSVSEGRELLRRETALALYQMLEQPLPGEMNGEDLGIVNAVPRVCWKTGTSAGNRDAWAFVFNAQYVVGVWVGNPNGRPSRRLVGAEAALPLAARVFRGLPVRPEPAWPDAGDELQRVEVCAVSGLPRSPWCEAMRTVLLPRRQYLNRVCEVHWPAGAEAARPGTIERWPASARAWDLAAIGPPPAETRAQASSADGPTRALQVLNPPGGARFIMTGESPGDRIRLRSSNDGQGPVHWYLDGKFLATAQPRQPVLLDLALGRHKVVCLTPEGASAMSRFEVAKPSE